MLIPAGFRMSGVHCGIKQDASKEDLTLIVTARPAVAAAVYTENLIVAAPVVLDRQRTPTDRLRVVVVNSGNANACTGQRGFRDAQEMARLGAQVCGAPAEQALVMSTGIIGHFLPLDKIAQGVRDAAARLGSDPASLLAAARGITTTDKSHKVAGRVLTLGGQEVRIVGMAKGAGMIGPRMATMLAIVMTDACLTPAAAQDCLRAAADRSFNCISVEGHTSTNDTLLLMASGAPSSPPLEGIERSQFQAALEDVCIELARMIPDDGEGASHLITIDVRGCATREDACRIAKTVANSALVKAGIAGADPNWGRIVSAAGYAGVPFDPSCVSLALNGIPVFQDGAPVPFDAAAVSQSIADHRETRIDLQFGEGDAGIRFWTSDLTVDYVRFNSFYTT